VRAHATLTPLEVACGLVLGVESLVEAAPREAERTPKLALEQAILPALLKPPCLVSFSGGRDSSLVLAAALSLARREGLSLPIPATNRFPEAPASDETTWQDRVIRHLQPSDWLRLDFTDELDVVGPIAARVLERHGLLWPFNAHFNVPLLETASGGSLLTGVGGDEVFGEGRWARSAAVLSRRVRPQLRDFLHVGLAVSPRPVRQAWLRRRFPAEFAWLRPSAKRALMTAWAADAASEPIRWESRLQWLRRLRYVQVGLESLELLARDSDVQLVHPLLDLGFLSALGSDGGFAGHTDRTAMMRRLLFDGLPQALYERRTKAHFDEVFWNRYSRAFAVGFAGDSIDHELVDCVALREIWSSDEPIAQTFTLLQALWLERDWAPRSSCHEIHNSTSRVCQ
jgi:asparagine synthase (glutamine-hydrolysing)